jgi:hypothetical protein
LKGYHLSLIIIGSINLLPTNVPCSGAAAFYASIVIKIGGCCHSRTTKIVAYCSGA